MSFIIHRISGPKVILLEFKQSTLTIGRGTTAQLRSENPSVALEHAVIEAVEGGFDLVDRGSITGTYLNGRAVENARLGPGDRIELGDILLIVQVAQPGKPLFLRVESLSTDDESIEEIVVPVGSQSIAMPVAGEKLKAPKVDYVASYRLKRGLLSKSALALALFLVALGGTLVVFHNERNELYRPGQLSVAHTQVVVDGVRLIGEDNCDACHERWRGASDSKCQACHKKTGHRIGLPPIGSCGECHAEHRQLANLTEVVEQRCTGCHRDLRANTVMQTFNVADKIADFENDHPEFKILALVDGVETRVAINSPEGRSADRNVLKFNHKCHMTGKCNKRPPTPSNPNQEVEQFVCASCHQIDETTGAALAVSYETTCIRCHPLTFDNRFPPVPHHLEFRTVAAVIANAYTGNERLLRMSADEVSRVLSQGRGQVNVASTIVRNAQRTLEARCKACHELSDDGASVIPPSGTTSWISGMKVFDHRAHLNESMKTACVDCHAQAKESEKASDLSMPGIDSCKPCHGAAGEKSASGIQTCQSCHFFHELSSVLGEGWTLRSAEGPAEMKIAAMERSGIGGAKPRLFGLPFWAAISVVPGVIVLIGVGGVFVGAARNVAKRPKAPPSLQEIRTPTEQKTPASKNTRPETDPSKGVQKPLPPKKQTEAATSVPEGTIAMDLSNFKEGLKDLTPGGTDATEYMGSIVFMSGPSAGRRFGIEPGKGFYIGRDKDLSEIVIDDGRISRRHLWVGMRGDQVKVIDQNSTNGARFEKEPAKRITEARLVDGDVVILGENVAVFRYEA